MKNAMIVTCIVAILLPATAAVADDFAPPWYRGLPLSYEVEWELNNPPSPGELPSLPTFEDAVDDSDPATFMYDRFGTHIDYDFGDNWAYVPADGDGGVQVVNPDGASLACNTINWVDDEPEKLIRIQITYIGQAPVIDYVTGYMTFYHGYPDPLPGNPESPRVDWDANHFYEDWIIFPNPEWEQIAISAAYGTIIDEIYIDTISLPEPASLLLLGFGAVVVMRRRR